MSAAVRKAVIAAAIASLAMALAVSLTGCTSAPSEPAKSAAAQPPSAEATAKTPAETLTPEPTAEPTRTAVPDITVNAVGDMIFDSSPKQLVRAQGGKAPLEKMASILRTADVTVGNLECPLSKRGSAVPGKTFTFQGDPRATQSLKAAGFDLLALANNHARDYGPDALADTFAYLEEAGLPWAGAGLNAAGAWEPAIIERNGATIAFLSFSEITPPNFAATSKRSGTAYTLDNAKVNRAIAAASKQADYVIVSFHWGVEGSYSPNARQVREGRAAIRAGADLVLSHHPHVIQGVEFYRKGLIAYSLANFLFDPADMRRHDSLLIHATMTRKGVKDVSVEPVFLHPAYGQPRIASGADGKRIIGIIKRTSKERGTAVEVDGNVLRLTP